MYIEINKNSFYKYLRSLGNKTLQILIKDIGKEIESKKEITYLEFLNFIKNEIAKNKRIYKVFYDIKYDKLIIIVYTDKWFRDVQYEFTEVNKKELFELLEKEIRRILRKRIFLSYFKIIEDFINTNKNENIEFIKKVLNDNVKNLLDMIFSNEKLLDGRTYCYVDFEDFCYFLLHKFFNFLTEENKKIVNDFLKNYFGDKKNRQRLKRLVKKEFQFMIEEAKKYKQYSKNTYEYKCIVIKKMLEILDDKKLKAQIISYLL